jgi:hypothetical protein
MDVGGRAPKVGAFRRQHGAVTERVRVRALK